MPNPSDFEVNPDNKINPETPDESPKKPADDAIDIPVKIIHPDTVEVLDSSEDTVQVTEVEEENDNDSVAFPEQHIAQLEQQLAEVSEKANLYWDSLLRQKAEMENLQKRVNRDLENARKYALEKFVSELLAVKDSMEMGAEAATKPEADLTTLQEGLTLTLRMLNTTLEKFGVQEINPHDQKFDPQWHEAMAMQPIPNVEAGTIVFVHQKGYQLNDRLIRPARVVVAKAIE
ncbi:nucleotide exchange factor GrpE [Thioflexithrix psekupsensis]|uniref:nucleotide exchange factor GrpE n=1 Tax=Thioflexithrix psekupsensis TaxID=1570016 RepID=UPI000A391CF6|nr:nucleotide exchange factor GrpE [Thioflexithrix psekupsensis]